MEHSSSPIDGFTLCEALHNKSVKILYINIKINALVQLKSKLDSPTNLTIFLYISGESISVTLAKWQRWSLNIPLCPMFM